MKRLARIFRRDAAPHEEEGPMPQPERLTFLVGDIHGCAEQLDGLLSNIADQAGSRAHDLVFLGDYIDRGPDSAGVLRRLMALDADQDSARRLTFLAGNHDHMLLHYLAHPEDGVRWLWVGGRDTLTSFGIGELRIADGGSDPMAERVAAQAQALAREMGEEMVQWLADRPLWWQSGNVIAVHALTDPLRPMDEQDDETLLWARPEKDLQPRSDGSWVIHGHTIVPEPTVMARHINVDTGAFRGGPLTAAVLEAGQALRFLRHDGTDHPVPTP